jgi:hypothetical protein
VNLITEFGPRTVSETELARIERDDLAFPKTVGRTLEEGKQLTAATQAAIVHTQAFRMGERFRWCKPRGAELLSKGYYAAKFRSVFGDLGVRVRRLRACGCHVGEAEPKRFAGMFATGGVAPELAYITTKFVTLLPFARVGDLFAECLPVGGAANSGTPLSRRQSWSG